MIKTVMLSQKNRIQKKKDIERIFKKGRAFKEAPLLLKTIKNNLGTSRFGFVVSQKVSKKANVRNKVKRRLREIVRPKLDSLKTCSDNLFITFPGIEKKDFLEIKKTVEKLFTKAKIK